MRILSIDGWDLPCALTAAASRHGAPGRDGRFKSSLRKCESVLEALSDGDMEDGKNALHVLEVAMPAIVVTKSNTYVGRRYGGNTNTARVPVALSCFMAVSPCTTRRSPVSARKDGRLTVHDVIKVAYFLGLHLELASIVVPTRSIGQ